MEMDQICMESNLDNTFYHIFTRIQIWIQMFSNVNTRWMSRIQKHIWILLNLEENIYHFYLLEIYKYKIL
jgi:hypothetical protein